MSAGLQTAGIAPGNDAVGIIKEGKKTLAQTQLSFALSVSLPQAV